MSNKKKKNKAEAQRQKNFQDLWNNATTVAPGASLPEITANTNQSTGNVPISNTTEIGMSAEQAADFNYQSGLLTLQGNINQELENLRGAWAYKGTDISTARELEARQYVVDRESATNENIANIQAANNLDLRRLIEAGETERENIRGTTARDVETIRGQFDVEGEKVRQAGAKDITNIQAQAGWRNALLGAFSF